MQKVAADKSNKPEVHMLTREGSMIVVIAGARMLTGKTSLLAEIVMNLPMAGLMLIRVIVRIVADGAAPGTDGIRQDWRFCLTRAHG